MSDNYDIIAERDREWGVALCEIGVACLAKSVRHGEIEVTHEEDVSALRSQLVTVTREREEAYSTLQKANIECDEHYDRADSAEQQIATLQAERDEWMISSGVHAKKAANLVQRCGQLEAALQDVSEAWREIKWRGVGNEFTGDADRCDVQKIEQALEDAARVLAGKE